ncbi:MAG: hypothetical protein JO347_04260, partial [Candidatus Eremiobacteraeota bacterium]|nr:hypothetical protein [Candidatus Eremiobacteraeota bacterium]
MTLLRLLRSPLSGVPHDIGAAYATVARRTPGLLEQIDRGQLALPSQDRDCVLEFAQRARRIRSLPAELDAQAVREAIVKTFSLMSATETPAESSIVNAPESELELADPVPREPAA